MANPTGLLNGAILMLQHIGQVDIAEKVQNALLKTLEDGIHTYDIYDEGKSSQKVGTREFAQAIIERLGQLPAKLKPASFNKESKGFDRALYEWKPKDHSEKTLVGYDIFIQWPGQDIDSYVADKLALINQSPNLEIALISNRGIKVWPNGNPSTFKTDHWRVRVKAKGAGASGAKIAVSAVDIAEIQVQLAKTGVDVIKTEGLYYFGDVPGFVKALNE
jgi:isocitrate dehydrogenase